VFYDSSTEPKLYELGIDFRDSIGEEDEYYASFTAETQAKYKAYLRGKARDKGSKTKAVDSAEEGSTQGNPAAKA
jgi:hypothetical protein